MTDDAGYVNEVMDLFQTRFAPCETMDQATHIFSTDEIFKAMKDLNHGTNVKREELYLILHDSGFRFMIEDQKFSFSLKWLLHAL